jgi:hypothetical protein
MLATGGTKPTGSAKVPLTVGLDYEPAMVGAGADRVAVVGWGWGWDGQAGGRWGRRGWAGVFAHHHARRREAAPPLTAHLPHPPHLPCPPHTASPQPPSAPRPLHPLLPHAPEQDKVLQIAADVAAAMCFMHSRGIVHGDLSPANILLTTNANAR